MGTIPGHDFYERIQQARRTKNWRVLERCGEELLDARRGSIYGYQILGEALEKMGKTQEALRLYEDALRVDSHRHRDTVGQTAFLKRLDILYNRSMAYDDCLRVCRYYVDRHPDSLDAWNRLKRAAKHTGRPNLASEAQQHADRIQRQHEIARKLKEARTERFRELYAAELHKLGYHSDVELADGDELPPPDGASAEEIAAWMERTTDGTRIDAELSAGLAAIEALHWEELERKRGAKRSMSPESRLKLVTRAIERLPECAHGGFITFTDRDNRENWVQLTDQYCNVPQRDWLVDSPAQLAQRDRLKELGFMSTDGLDRSADSLRDHTAIEPHALAEFVLEIFSRLGSSSDFEIVVEFEDM